ncbi:MAG: helix-turn-helix domain-containing protein [Actinomycetota bacterium]|nr:helix-turn-helix domain-containing protein [Actinomycetota bacterium]
MVTRQVEPRFASRLPAPALRPYIDRSVGYRVDGMPAAVHRGLPSRYLTMIVSIGEPIEVLAQSDPASAPGVFEFMLAGLHVTPALIAADGPQEGVTIELTPLGCRALLGMPTLALWNSAVEADTVIGRAATELRHRLHESSRWAERFSCCDEVLSKVVDVLSREVAAPLRGAWQLLVASGGTIAVSDLADRIGWSRRHLAQRFAEEFGLSPKAAARVLRFERACGLLRSARRASIADVAVACGYFDQPHLNRDFAALAGCPPTEWLAAELPFVQDGEAGAQQDCRHERYPSARGGGDVGHRRQGRLAVRPAQTGQRLGVRPV